MNIPGFSPSGIDYTIDVERYDSTSGSFVPVTQITGVQRDQFPYTIGNLADGVYAVRVDGQTPTGTRTFSISRKSIPAGKKTKVLQEVVIKKQQASCVWFAIIRPTDHTHYGSSWGTLRMRPAHRIYRWVHIRMHWYVTIFRSNSAASVVWWKLSAGLLPHQLWSNWCLHLNIACLWWPVPHGVHHPSWGFSLCWLFCCVCSRGVDVAVWETPCRRFPWKLWSKSSRLCMFCINKWCGSILFLQNIHTYTHL